MIITFSPPKPTFVSWMPAFSLQKWNRTQWTQDIDPMLFYCRADVEDGGLTLNQLWVNVSCLLGSSKLSMFLFIFYSVNRYNFFRLGVFLWWENFTSCSVETTGPPPPQRTKQHRSQQARDVDPMLLWCWASVADGGSALQQHWVNVSCNYWGVALDFKQTLWNKKCYGICKFMTFLCITDTVESSADLMLITDNTDHFKPLPARESIIIMRYFEENLFLKRCQ